KRPPSIPGIERLAAGVPLGDGAEDLPPAALPSALSIRQLDRISREHSPNHVHQPRATEIGQVRGAEAHVVGTGEGQAARPLAKLPLVLGEEIDEQLAPAGRDEGKLSDAL